MEVRLPPIGKSLVVGGEVDGAYSAERRAPLPFDDFTFVAVFDPNLDNLEMIDEYYRVLKFNGRLSFEVQHSDDLLIREALQGFQIVKRKIVGGGAGVYRVNLVARKVCCEGRSI